MELFLYKFLNKSTVCGNCHNRLEYRTVHVWDEEKQPYHNLHLLQLKMQFQNGMTYKDVAAYA